VTERSEEICIKSIKEDAMEQHAISQRTRLEIVWQEFCGFSHAENGD
jgi:hypothetical protein